MADPRKNQHRLPTHTRRIPPMGRPRLHLHVQLLGRIKTHRRLVPVQEISTLETRSRERSTCIARFCGFRPTPKRLVRPGYAGPVPSGFLGLGWDVWGFRGHCRERKRVRCDVLKWRYLGNRGVSLLTMREGKGERRGM